jgi:hypothetical protein
MAITAIAGTDITATADIAGTGAATLIADGIDGHRPLLP